MGRTLTEWFILARETPGEKYPLASVGKSPAKVGDIYDNFDLNQTLDWSGKFYGMPDNLEKIIETQQYDVKPEQVLTVLGGTNMGIYLTCMAVLKPGDEVICKTPAWGEVPSICKRLGIDLKYWWLRPENDWKPDFGELKELINAKTKLIYINHPNNPTGSILSAAEMRELCDIASKYGTYIVSDEVYRGLEWETNDLSPAIVNCYERGVSASSLTKLFGVTGLRFGWFATKDKDLFTDMFGIIYDSVLCNSMLTEVIGGKFLEPENYKKLLNEGKDKGRKNLEVLTKMVDGSEIWSMSPPGGAYSCFARYKTTEPSWDFCERMLKKKPKGVYLVPGSCYNDAFEYHIRIGFGDDPELFAKGVEVVEQGAREYKE